jgi:dimethylargininase
MITDTAAVPGARIALVRRPSGRLAEGRVTHIERRPVDVALARKQHDAYLSALKASGWAVLEVPPAEDCPDSVFVEDTVVIFGGFAVLTRPGALERQPEVTAVEEIVRDLGLSVTRIEAPATLDGGDVLQVGSTVYVGRSDRTNAAGVQQLRRLLAGAGTSAGQDRRVVPVAVDRVLHLKSAATALPDGTVLTFPRLVDTEVFPAVRLVDEEPGCHVVPLGGPDVLIAASAPKTTAELRGLGFSPVVVDISEFEKLEGCVTCLSVMLEMRSIPTARPTRTPENQAGPQ